MIFAVSVPRQVDFARSAADGPRGARHTAGGDMHAKGLFGRMEACVTILLIASAPGRSLLAGNEGRGDPPAIDLTLKDAVVLTLGNNRSLINARLDRAVERFSLRVEENRYRPHVTIGPYVDGSDDRNSGWSATAGVSSKAVLRIPTGGAFALDWRGSGENREALSGQRYFNELRFTFTQPLLRGAGADIDTASVWIARLTEDINVLALREATADVVSSVIRSYRVHMQAERQVDIRRKSLERARNQLAVNETLVGTGRMAERDLVQTQADIAGRELDLLVAENRLDAARLALTDIMDVDSGTRFWLVDRLDPESAQADVEHALETALENRYDYRRALLRVENAETRALVARDGRQWDLSLTLSATASHADEFPGSAASGRDNLDYGAGLRLAIPIGRAAVDPAELAHLRASTELTKARNDLANLRQRIEIEVSNAVREVTLSARQIDLARAARVLTEQKTEIEQEKLRLGLSSSFRVVASEEDLVATQNRELNAIIAHLDAWTALDRTLGVTLDKWNIEIRAEGPDTSQ